MSDQVSVAPPVDDGRRQGMRAPDEVAAMLRLRALGWGTRRIAAELGCDRETVRRYLAAGGWAPYRAPARPGVLAGHGAWLAERFRRHRGNADVVRQELAAELGITVSLRTVERAVAHLRRELAAEALATVRFETPPGSQMQIDFGECGVTLGGERVRVHLFVATLGYSRRVYVRAFRHQRQSAAWLDGIEGAFRHFGGVPGELLLDNAKALVEHHDRATREVAFNERLHAFARYWGVRPVACAPYRARTKGKDERGVGYVKGNAIAGRSFPSRAALEAHLARWMRELTRRVQNDGCVDVDTNRYSVPWTLIGAPVSVVVSGGEVRILHAGAEVAHHGQRRGRRERAASSRRSATRGWCCFGLAERGCESLVRGAEAEALAGCGVHACLDLLQAGRGEGGEVELARQEAAEPAVDVLDAALLPW